MSSEAKLPRRANVYRDRFTDRLYLLVALATKAGLAPGAGIPDVVVFVDLLTHDFVHAPHPDPERRFLPVEDEAEIERHAREREEDESQTEG